MSKLILQSYKIEWRKKTDVPEYKQSMKAQQGEKVFIYGKTESYSTDETNRDIVMKHFGFAKTLKRNYMAINHVSSISGASKNSIDYNKQRLEEISKMNFTVTDFFLSALHQLTWDDYDRGVLSTIPFDEAFELLVPTMKMVYEILAAGVEDKYSQDLSIAEMKNVLDKHNMLIDQTLGKNIPKSKRKDSD